MIISVTFVKFREMGTFMLIETEIDEASITQF